MSRWSLQETPQPVVEHHTAKFTRFCQNPIESVCQRPMTVSELMCGNRYLANISSSSAVKSPRPRLELAAFSGITTWMWASRRSFPRHSGWSRHMLGSLHLSLEGIGVRVHTDEGPLDMFFTLTNVQSGGWGVGWGVPLQLPIDNQCSDLRVGLWSITYTVVWYNVEPGSTFPWREVGGHASAVPIPPGLFRVEKLQEIFEESTKLIGITLSVSKENGLINLTVRGDWEVLFTEGLLQLLGLDDGLGGQWLGAGIYTGDRPVIFATTKSVRIL